MLLVPSDPLRPRRPDEHFAPEARAARELGVPGWYAKMTELTPRSVWTVGTQRADFDRARQEIGPGPAVLRDYSKSMKHYWHEALFIPDTGDGDATWNVASRFLELRDDELVGGFVLRRFEPLSSGEVRTWWVDGECVLTGPHPDTPDDQPPVALDVDSIGAAVHGLDLPFVTVDLALRTDGVWRVVEVGDGQVSDRPGTIEPATLVSAILRRPSASGHRV